MISNIRIINEKLYHGKAHSATKACRRNVKYIPVTVCIIMAGCGNRGQLVVAFTSTVLGTIVLQEGASNLK